MASNTLFVRPLPASATNERLEEIFSDIGPVKQCFVVKEKGTEKCRGFGYVTFSLEEDAQRALKEIQEYNGQTLSLSVAKKKIKDKKKKAPKDADVAPKESKEKCKGLRKKILKSKLIIRNLSFKCSEDDLKQIFAKFGIVLEAKIPLKPDGKMRGFAFVLFKNVSEAAKALQAMNLKEIKGRPVAVDWAVPKDKYLSMRQVSNAGNETEEAATKQTESKSDTEDDDEEQKEAVPKKKVNTKTIVQEVEESQSEDGDNDDDDSEEEEEEEEDDDSEEEEEEEEDDDDDDELAPKKISKKPLSADVKDGRTIFIRNLSFDTEEEGIEKVLLQYGELNYIKIVLHPETGHSKGCAFAQFKTKEAADRCIAAAADEAENRGIRLDGRKLSIVPAVSREDAVKMKNNKVKVETGTRNLYLAREGLIRAGTKAAEGIPEADMNKRARFEEIKRAKLRDLNVFVSKTRLCVHNLPKSVDAKKLKALCFQAVKGNKGVCVTECRVMYDKKPEKGQVKGQSLGYGFVQFKEHEHALTTLRHLNNNPDIFGSHKRPIVEFSLEDSRKLKIKELRHQKSKEFLRKKALKAGVKLESQIAVQGNGSKKEGLKHQSFLGQTKPMKAHPLDQKPNRYSGFKTNPEVEHVDLQNGKKRKKVLPFPSHRGPKNRMRDKGKQVQPPKKARPGSRRKDDQRQYMEKAMQPKKQKVNAGKKISRSQDRDHFESLVEQYKKKLMGSADKNTTIKRNKWFQS